MPFAIIPVRQLGSRSCARWAKSLRRPYSSQSSPPNNQQRPGDATAAKNLPTPASSPPSAPPAIRFYNWYKHHERHSPRTTQLVIAPFIYLAGDLSAQLLSGDDYDPLRAARAVIVGAAIAIPSYRWLMLLSRHFNYSSAALSTAAKVVVNQAVFTPVFNVYFFGSHALLEGEDAAGALQRVASSVPQSIPRSCLYWPLVSAFTFTYVQAQSRAVVMGLFAIAWQSYLSWLNRQTDMGEPRGTAGLLLDAES